MSCASWAVGRRPGTIRYHEVTIVHFRFPGRRPALFVDKVPGARKRRALVPRRLSVNAQGLRRLVVPALLLLVSGASHAAPSFTAFESGQVRPLALSPDGSRLFAVNTPDNRLEVFNVTEQRLEHLSSVPVGLEPVSVAALDEHRVWVVNHLSDSVSVVDVRGRNAQVVRTLLVGDEPRDIVFAGTRDAPRAFVTAAHRGQNTPFDPKLAEPGVGRADVWVFDAFDQGDALGGTPLAIVNLFSDTPRALAVSPDGTEVYAASFASGNRTAIVALNQTPDGGEGAGGIPLPNVNHAGLPEPDMSLIVKHDGTHWVDETGRAWDDYIRFDLPDSDVFTIDATATPPRLRPGGAVSDVGTIIFNLIANPVSGTLYATNTEARNHVRFEGPGRFAATTVRGHAVENRITLIDDGVASPRLLNKHIDRDTCCASMLDAERALSVSQPNGMAITPDGSTLYVSVLGNDKVVAYDTAALEDDTFYPDSTTQIVLSGGGPTGLVLDAPRKRLYVLTRFDNGIAIVDTAEGAEIGHLRMHSPEPRSIVRGRRFLYDALLTSGGGDQSCASCHVFGDKDELAWDLGDPDGDVVEPPDIFAAHFGIGQTAFHPMKGPMATQSLRGLANHGPMHWRGDRNGRGLGADSQPDGGAFSEKAAFNAFNVAFEGLLGRNAPLSSRQMQAFTDFQLQVMYPPNPIRALDNSLNADQALGREFFFTAPALAFGKVFRCVDCHALDREGNAEFGVNFPGFFGTDGRLIEGEFSQTFKIPHLRNLYTKIGSFGLGEDAVFNRPDLPFYEPAHQGEQIRAFGFTHDGSIDTPVRFLNSLTPTPFAPDVGFTELEDMRRMAAFLLAFDSNLRPIVGQQITLPPERPQAVLARVQLLRERAAAGECELVAKTFYRGRERGFVLEGDRFHVDTEAEPPVTDAELERLASRHRAAITYTCVPPGSGRRLGIDRDGDGRRDGDELRASANPADPAN